MSISPQLFASFLLARDLPASIEDLPELQELHLAACPHLKGLELGLIWGYRSTILNTLCKRGCAIIL